MAVAIFGATSRIAQQIAHVYAAAGHAVFVAARDIEEAERIASDIAIRHGYQTAFEHFDAADFSSHPALVEEIARTIGPIDVAVLAFGAMNGGDEAPSPEEVQRIIDINFTGAASLCEQLAAHMVPRGEGSIIGISSVAGDRGRASNYLYGSAKGGFTLYLQGLRNRLFSEGVHVMTVKLGFIDTRMTFGMKTAIPIASPEQAAKAIYRNQQRHADSLYYPRFWGGVMGIIRAIPEKVFKRLSL